MAKQHKRCKCGELATRGTYHTREIPRAPGAWREFEHVGEELLGCKKHPPEPYTTYLDGRVIRTAHAKAERVTEGLVQ